MNGIAIIGMANASVRRVQDEPGLTMKSVRIKFIGKMADARWFMGMPPIYYRS
jgi:hypothetical protein